MLGESAVETVRRIFALHEAGFAQDGIAMILEREGYLTSQGRLFTPSGVARILHHEELYRTGIRYWGGEVSATRWPILLES